MKPLKSKVSITLDSDIIEKIKQLAEQDDRSFSQYINMILKEHLKDPDINKETEAAYVSLLYLFFFNFWYAASIHLHKQHIFYGTKECRGKQQQKFQHSIHDNPH